MTDASGRSRRLWRLRKLHQWVDAEIHDHAAGGVELQFLYAGEVSYRQQWSTHAAALEEAARKRAELEREGWTFHW